MMHARHKMLMTDSDGGFAQTIRHSGAARARRVLMCTAAAINTVDWVRVTDGYAGRLTDGLMGFVFGQALELTRLKDGDG